MLANRNNGKVLAKNVRVCCNAWCKAHGLMFSREQKGHALVFDFQKEKKANLHMLFVFYPIDVILLDSRKTVVEIRANLMPFTFYNSKQRARFVIEANAGAAEKAAVKIGDNLEFPENADY